jgi:hypothetical protein
VFARGDLCGKIAEMATRGRPKLPPKELRIAFLQARFTESEEQQIVAVAREMNLTVSEVIRIFVLSAIERKRRAA